MGGGAGISMHANIRIATETTVWSMPENKIGFFADVGVTYHLARLGQAKGFDMSYGLYLAVSAGRVIGKENVLCGLATHYVKTAKL